jgi:hypothetical protein
MMTMLDHALHYASLGLRVHPVHGITPEGRCTCQSTDPKHQPGKHPVLLDWTNAATTEASSIQQWFATSRWNLGIATGEASGVFCLDIDSHHGGEHSLQNAAEALGPMPATWTVATGSGGKHYYFRHPGNPVRIATKTNVLEAWSLPGIDTRGDGGQVVAPPSRHHSGSEYDWTLGPWDVPLADLPLRWIRLLLNAGVWKTGEPEIAPLTIKRKVVTAGDASQWAMTAFQRETERAKNAPTGSGNQELFNAGCQLFEIVKGGHLPHDLVHDSLMDAATSTGRRSHSEAEKTLQSAWRRVSPRYPQATIQRW